MAETAKSQVASESTEKIPAGCMPSWDVGELPAAPNFQWGRWTALIGPGLMMAGANIGGGEWLFGPAVTAQYGATLMWVAALSIAFQVFYNLEVMRYTLYCGEPIFTGKFRTLPGPMFWVFFYLLLDWGSLFPYLVVNAAVAIEEMFVDGFGIRRNCNLNGFTDQSKVECIGLESVRFFRLNPHHFKSSESVREGEPIDGIFKTYFINSIK